MSHWVLCCPLEVVKWVRTLLSCSYPTTRESAKLWCEMSGNQRHNPLSSRNSLSLRDSSTDYLRDSFRFVNRFFRFSSIGFLQKYFERFSFRISLLLSELSFFPEYDRLGRIKWNCLPYTFYSSSTPKMMKRNSLHLMPYFISFIPSSPLFSTNQPTSFRPYWALCTTFIRGLHLHNTELACPQLWNPQKQNVVFENMI